MNEQITSLRVERQAKKIQVNDQGEYIVLNLDDQQFLPELLGLMNDFKGIAEKNENRAREIDEMPDGTDKEYMAKAEKSAAFNLEVCEELKQRVDQTFHDDVCRKVFGDIVPSIAAFAEFFDQLGELIKKFTEERRAVQNERVAKYTAKYHQKG